MVTYLERFNQAFEGVDNANIISNNYVIAYIDLLGFAERINENNDKVISDLNKLYNILLTFINQDDNCFGFKDVKVKIFSDNVIISQELSNVNTNEIVIQNVFRLCSIFQFYALTSFGWLLRGGISIGKFYINNIFSIGNGLINAYKLESTIAIYPRIIIDKEILTNIKLENFHAPYGIPKIYQDIDGIYYLNYLSTFNKLIIQKSVKEYSEYFKKIIITEKNDKILQKLNWQISYLAKVYEWTKENNFYNHIDE